MSRKTILVTGGAGYIGSHTCVELLAKGYELVVVDNLCNSSPKALLRVAELAGVAELPFCQGDIRDRSFLDKVFNDYPIAAVIHFAGLKAVGESVQQPLRYFDNNVSGTLNLLQAMQAHQVKSIVFSSSATVYGDPHTTPIVEDFPRSATNPYGRSKLMVEDMLLDLYQSDPQWQVGLLRYFNPVGAHISGKIGEDPAGVPNNLMPYIARVAVGQYPHLSVFGDDYPTPDGTGVRDYIHVVDLAKGHVSALQVFEAEQAGHLLITNLGTGQGYSVLEMVKAFAKASGRDIPYEVVPRRQGDIASCYADPAHALAVMGWRAEKTLDDMCIDSWRWQHNNPQGYQ